MSISHSEEQNIDRWLARFYGDEGPELSHIEREVLILLMDRERAELKKQLAMMRGG